MPDVADRRWSGADFAGSTDALLAEIDRLAARYQAAPDAETARDLLWLRHLAGIRIVDEHRHSPAPSPVPAEPVPVSPAGLPEVDGPSLTPGLVRGAIQGHGYLIVRRLVDAATATRFAARIDEAYAARDGALAVPGYYEEFEPKPPYRSPARQWTKAGGGLKASDSPILSCERMQLFEALGIRELASGYLGGPAVLATQKSTFRRVEPSVTGAWHQDGAFLGEVGSLDLWISLSHCGVDAPGLDIVGGRLDSLVAAGAGGVWLDTQVSPAMAKEAAGAYSIVRPIFEPGDAVLFDELCLHQTASEPSMTKPRHAIESWFFNASRMPDGYAPIAL